MGHIKTIFRALQYRNFRLFFLGQTVSLTGTWIQSVAVSWLVYRLTDSAFWLGMVGLVTQLPSFIFTPFAGVLADRFNRHKMIIVCQVLSMLHAAALSWLVFFGNVRLDIVMALGVFIGFVNATEIPTRHAFLYAMVGRKEDLPNAIALQSFMFNFARLVGPTLAGIAIGFWGEGVCFLANSLSYIAVIVALAMMRDIPFSGTPLRAGAWEHLKEGVVYTFRSAPIRTMLSLVALMSMTGMVKAVLMPVFAKQVLHGGPRTLGFLMASVGSGALAGAVYLASRKSAVKLVTIIPGAIGLCGAAFIAFALSRSFWFSAAMLFVAGAGLMSNMVCCSTILQTFAADEKRGRVMSFYTMAFMGMATAGSGLGGSLATWLGAPCTVALAGFVSIAAAVLSRGSLRRIRNELRGKRSVAVEMNGVSEG